MSESFQPTIVSRYRDAASQFRWRLRAANHEIVAASHRGWDTAEEVEVNVRDLTDELLAAENVRYEESGDGWRWHVDGVGKSSEAFASRHNAERNCEDVTTRLSHGYTIEDAQPPPLPVSSE